MDENKEHHLEEPVVTEPITEPAPSEAPAAQTEAPAIHQDLQETENNQNAKEQVMNMLSELTKESAGDGQPVYNLEPASDHNQPIDNQLNTFSGEKKTYRGFLPALIALIKKWFKGREEKKAAKIAAKA